MKRISAALFIALCLTACAAPERAVPTAEPEAISAEESLPPVPELPQPEARPDYPDVKVYFDGLLTDRGYLVGDEAYISPETVCGFFGVELTVEESAQVEISAPGLRLTASAGQEYMLANGRYLYTPYGYLSAGGRIYLPASAIERVFGVQVQPLSEDGRQVEIAGGGIVFISGGEDYYENTYPSEDLFWLSRIIYAEARDEPMAGLIGVGNVVLNRVESPDFPSTVYTVIYDREFSVQFEPITTGGVYVDPDERSVIAACLALDGYNTVGDSLYFVNPDKGANPWFEDDLIPTVTIGRHHFYTGTLREDGQDA